MEGSNNLLRLLRNLIYIISSNRTVSQTTNFDFIQPAIQWLCKAHDSSPDDGVSAGYHLYHGWQNSYPETTGYIIPTFIEYSTLYHVDDIYKRAIRMANWELLIQNKEGSINGGQINSGLGPIVFDTGQVIFGLLSAFHLTDDDKYLRGAIKCGDWLVEHQNVDGSWTTFSYNKIPHTYHTRVSWALIKLFKATNKTSYRSAAIRNIEWAITNLNSNYWFDNCGFDNLNSKSPYTHTIAYTIRGILESGKELGEGRYISVAKRCSEAIVETLNPSGAFPGELDKNFTSKHKYTCLTGNAQLSIILLNLYDIFNEDYLFYLAKKINSFLKMSQLANLSNNNLDGSIPGSKPIWGKYLHFYIPNWAVKFFIDALLLEDRLTCKRKANDISSQK